mmetsp:Transcript_47320/g.143295  ORF Transcript_47320/g.143295 Transcript_47320/m.143295 type:complete len:224 (-) Transcript_47320:32-703(-)
MGTRMPPPPMPPPAATMSPIVAQKNPTKSFPPRGRRGLCSSLKVSFSAPSRRARPIHATTEPPPPPPPAAPSESCGDETSPNVGWSHPASHSADDGHSTPPFSSDDDADTHAAEHTAATARIDQGTTREWRDGSTTGAATSSRPSRVASSASAAGRVMVSLPSRANWSEGECRGLFLLRPFGYRSSDSISSAWKAFARTDWSEDCPWRACSGVDTAIIVTVLK